MGKWIPVPELAEHDHANDGAGVLRARPALQADSHVTATRIDEALSKSSPEASHRILVFVTHNFGIRRSSRS